MSIPIECPACEHHFDVPMRYGGKKGKCPECGNVFTAPKSAPVESVTTHASGEPPPVSTNGDRSTNGEAVCVVPKIPLPRQVAQRVPTRIPQAPPNDLDDEPPADPFFMPAHRPPPGEPSSEPLPPPRPRRASNAPMIAITSLLVVLVILCVAAVAVINPFAEPAPPPPENNDVVENSNFDEPEDVDDTREPALPPIPSDDDLARLWEDVLPFICHIAVETDTGKISESGFVVDTRGWVATNYHTIKDAKSIRVSLGVVDESVAPKLARVTGLIATDPQHDLAILAIENEDSFSKMPLTPDYEPTAGDVMIAAGYASNGDGLYAACRIEQAISVQRMSPGLNSYLRERQLDETTDLFLIEHTVQVIPGVSGAPLLNTKGEAIGMNVRLNPNSANGYAIPIEHLIALKDAATGDVTPLPNAEPVTEPMDPPKPNTLTSVDLIKQLHEDAKKMSWLPRTAGEYESLRKLAHHVTEAQIKKDDETIEEGLRGLLDIFSQGVLDELSNTAWPTAAELADFNEMASASLESPELGFFAYAEVVMPAIESQKIDDEETVVFELIGTETWVVLTVGENADALKKGTRWRILGTRDPEIQVVMKGDGADIPDRTAMLIRAKYLVGEPQ